MRRLLAGFSLLALVSGPMTPEARAQFQVVAGTAQIQEDWQLVVAQGDPSHDGPQIMSYMSPANDSSAPYLWFMINVRDSPNPYSAGGLQIQVWDYSNNLLGSATSAQDTGKLNTLNETITWTQRLAIDTKNSLMTFDVLNGNSTTWGTFGSSQDLGAVTVSGSYNLNTYDPNVSVQKARVGWQANNVTSLKLLTVRQYDRNGKLIATTNVNLSVNLTPQ